MQSSAAVPVTGVASPEKASGRNNDEHSSAYRRDSNSELAVAEHVLSPNLRLHTDALISYFQQLIQHNEDADIAKSYVKRFRKFLVCRYQEPLAGGSVRATRSFGGSGNAASVWQAAQRPAAQSAAESGGARQKTGLSEATIKFIETARTRATRGTLLRLWQSRSWGFHGLTWRFCASCRCQSIIRRCAELGEASPMNWYVTPGYDGVRLVEDLARFLQGQAGSSSRHRRIWTITARWIIWR